MDCFKWSVTLSPAEQTLQIPWRPESAKDWLSTRLEINKIVLIRVATSSSKRDRAELSAIFLKCRPLWLWKRPATPWKKSKPPWAMLSGNLGPVINVLNARSKHLTPWNATSWGNSHCVNQLAPRPVANHCANTPDLPVWPSPHNGTSYYSLSPSLSLGIVTIDYR